ncbi:RraA family protein [Komagataeibacter sp. AV436]|uniref:Putative 4-hydroxy-4-methyl-2-oxoglutarate aldolase n=1 Tax=Komagataeibacter melomenusus TaxID=2766578 RepID=A0ABX2ABI5_9PROT|nr:RraA family protein [Komagataeibacter melomenusus]MBV1830103.1 RraA family protein [Komagataeibacter melomenusus]NPC65590.1 RraA family protein [Komagataeibacter melomenusus]
MLPKYIVNPMPAQGSKEVMDLLDGVETATIGHWRLMGFCNRRIQPMLRGRHVVGTAVTLAIPGPDSTLLHHAAGLLRPGDILLIDRLGDDRYACWGGGVTAAVKASGATAGVVDGPITDIAEIEESDLPIWSAGIAPITTRIYDLGGRMNVPVSIGGAVVQPGDYVLADDSGVVVLPPAEAEAEARRALAVQARGKESERMFRAREILLGERSGASTKVREGC